MKAMRFFLNVAVAISVLLMSCLQAAAYDQALRVIDGTVVSSRSLVKELGAKDLVFIGEAHAINKHHRAQLAVIRELHEAETPLAVGVEMFVADQQDVLDEWIAGRMGEDEFRRAFEVNWQYDWSLYRDIFIYARMHGIPLVALNVPKDISKKVAREGFDSLTQDDLKRLPIDITCDVDKEYRDYIRNAHKMHGRSGKSFEHFCEAQLLWDKVMAHHLKEYLAAEPGTTVVVLAGFGHSWKKGIPEQIRRSSGYTYAVIHNMIPGMMPDDISIEFYDYILN